MSNPFLDFFTVYRPSYYNSNAESYINTLIDCFTEYSSNNRVNVVLGDFNLPHKLEYILRSNG